MSIKLMARVWDCAFDHGQQAVMLAMADHADDDGNNCYPAVPLIAWKTGYSERQVTRIMQSLRGMRVLIIDTAATNKHPAKYAIRIENAPLKRKYGESRGDMVSPQEVPVEVTSAHLEVTFETSRGDMVSPKPLIEPSLTTTSSSSLSETAKNESAEQPKQQPSPSDSDYKILVAKLESAGVILSPLLAEQYNDMLATFGLRPVLDGITAATKQGKQYSFAYVGACARNIYQNNGKPSERGATNGNGTAVPADRPANWEPTDYAWTNLSQMQGHGQ